MKNNMGVIIAVAIIVGIAGFFGGMKYAETKSLSNQSFGGRTGNTTGNGTGRFGGGNRGAGSSGGAVTGQVLSVDDKSVTVKLQDGSSKIVLLSDKTTINKASQATVSDIKSGETIAVFGSTNSDGSVTAQNVQLNPMFAGRRAQITPAPKSSDAKEVAVTASSYKFSPTTITVKKGEKTRILLKNSDGMHDLVIDEFNVRTNVIGAGTEDYFEFTPDKTGTFEYYCSVGNHRAMGMIGKLTVQ